MIYFTEKIFIAMIYIIFTIFCTRVCCVETRAMNMQIQYSFLIRKIE